MWEFSYNKCADVCLVHPDVFMLSHYYNIYFNSLCKIISNHRPIQPKCKWKKAPLLSSQSLRQACQIMNDDWNNISLGSPSLGLFIHNLLHRSPFITILAKFVDLCISMSHHVTYLRLSVLLNLSVELFLNSLKVARCIAYA